MEYKTFSTDIDLRRMQEGHKGAILAGCFDPTDSTIVTGGRDSLIKIWKLNEPKHKGVIRCVSHTGHTEAVNAVTVVKDGSVILSASDDGSVRLWSQASYFCNSTGFRAHTKSVKSVTTSGDMSFIATGGMDKVAKVWYLDNSQRIFCSLTGHTNWINAVRFSSCSKFLLTASDDKSVRLWDWKNKTIIASFQNHKGLVLDTQFKPSDDQQIATCDDSGAVYVYDVRNGKMLQMFDRHGDAAKSVEFHPSGAFLCSASKDGALNIYDLIEKRVLYSVTNASGPLNFGRFSHDGKLLLIGSDTGKFFLYDIKVEIHQMANPPVVADAPNGQMINQSSGRHGILREVQNQGGSASEEPLYSLSPPKQLSSTRTPPTQLSEKQKTPVTKPNYNAQRQLPTAESTSRQQQFVPDLGELTPLSTIQGSTATAHLVQPTAKETRPAHTSSSSVQVQTEENQQITGVTLELLNDIFEQLQLMTNTVKVVHEKQAILDTNVETLRDQQQLAIAQLASRIEALEQANNNSD